MLSTNANEYPTAIIIALKLKIKKYASTAVSFDISEGIKSAHFSAKIKKIRLKICQKSMILVLFVLREGEKKNENCSQIDCIPELCSMLANKNSCALQNIVSFLLNIKLLLHD